MLLGCFSTVSWEISCFFGGSWVFSAYVLSMSFSWLVWGNQVVSLGISGFFGVTGWALEGVWALWKRINWFSSGLGATIHWPKAVEVLVDTASWGHSVYCRRCPKRKHLKNWLLVVAKLQAMGISKAAPCTDSKRLAGGMLVPGMSLVVEKASCLVSKKESWGVFAWRFGWMSSTLLGMYVPFVENSGNISRPCWSWFESGCFLKENQTTALSSEKLLTDKTCPNCSGFYQVCGSFSCFQSRVLH